MVALAIIALVVIVIVVVVVMSGDDDGTTETPAPDVTTSLWDGRFEGSLGRVA
ncbi:MAG: hypothetical protein M3271_00260 [Actinomycetota bacterium]|nr:hypothetical protein [Actinomycetota bacterium]